MSDPHPSDLSKLPKGSDCTDWKQVPARSSYWTDETRTVERCANWSTPGGDDGGGASDESGGEGDESPSFEWNDSQWLKRYKIGGGTWELTKEAGAYLQYDDTNSNNRLIVNYGPRRDPKFDIDLTSQIRSTITQTVGGYRYEDPSLARTLAKEIMRYYAGETWNEQTIDRNGLPDEIDVPIPHDERDEETDDDDTTGYDDVGEWETVDPGDGEIARWKAPYGDPLSDTETQYVTLERDSTPSTDEWYFSFHFVGSVSDGARKTQIANAGDEFDVLEETRDWLTEHQPDAWPSLDPVNGWEQTRHAVTGLDNWDGVVDWERWAVPRPAYPEKRKERIRIFKDGSKYHVRFAYLDNDGGRLSTTTRDLPTLPDKRSMTTRGSKGKVTKFTDLDRPVEYAKDYMEANAPNKTDWPEIPRFNLHMTEQGDMKNIGELLKRAANDDVRSRTTTLEIDRTDIRFEGVDSQNVSMFEIELLRSWFETNQYNREALENVDLGKCVLDARKLGDAITSANKSETLRLRTLEPRETNDPVKLLVRGDADDAEIRLWPHEGKHDIEIPDLDYSAAFTANVGDFEGVLKEAKGDQSDSDSPSVTINVDPSDVTVDWDGGDDRLPTNNRRADDGEASATYSISKLRNLTMSIPRPSTKSFVGKLTDDHPIRIETDLGPNNIMYLVAPRVDTNQPDCPNA